MEKVQKWVEEKEAWRNAKTNAQNQLAVHQNPVVLARDIRSETAVSQNMLKFKGNYTCTYFSYINVYK